MEKYGKAFEELSFKEKTEHIWEYYRWHIIGTVAGVFIFISLMITILTPQKEYTADIFIAGKLISDEAYQQTAAHFENEWDTRLTLSAVNFENVGELEMATMQKIPLLIRIKELDILIISKSQFMNYLNQGAADVFIPLETVEGLETLLETKKESLITSQDIDTNHEDETIQAELEALKTKGHIYGLTVKAVPPILGMELKEEMVAGITSSVKDLPKTTELFNYLLQ